MTRRIVICVFLFLLPIALLAGTITDKETGEPLAGVNVPVGAYNLRASYISYKEVVVQNQRISLDLTTEVNFELEHNDSIDSAVRGFVKGN